MYSTPKHKRTRNRKRKRGNQLIKALLNLQISSSRLNAGNYLSISSHTVNLDVLMNCITGPTNALKHTPTRNILPVGITLATINKWLDEKLVYYNKPYIAELYMTSSIILLKLTNIGAMDRDDSLVEVLHI